MSTPSPPLPSPPFFTVPNINNLRDAALFPLTTPSGRITPNILFRSADVSKLDMSGWRALHALGIAHVFDLRSKPEVDGSVASHPGSSNGAAVPAVPACITAMQAAGVQRTWVPVFAAHDYSPQGLAKRYVKYMDEEVKGFVAAYHDILASGGPAFATIFRYLANLPPVVSSSSSSSSSSSESAAAKPAHPPRGALIHCTAGKDRTGIFFGVLLAFLGVDKRTIADEYHLTERGLLPVRDDVVARLLTSPAFREYMAAQARIIADEKSGVQGAEVLLEPDALEKGRQAALRMVGAKTESMLGALDMLEREFGGAEMYMRDVCGLSDEEMESLRRNLVVRE